MPSRFTPEQAVGVVLVLLIHAIALYGLWSYRLLPTREDAVTLFVNFIAPPVVAPPPPKREPPRPKPLVPPPARQLVAQAAVVAPDDVVAPPPPATPPAAIEAPPAPPPKPAAPVGPVALGSELAVACPERTPPAYPTLSRRLGETGTVTLRVELDEQGRVATARVDNGSGHERLDQAALTAVKTWRCQPPMRDGLAQRAIARQPFKFVLQGT